MITPAKAEQAKSSKESFNYLANQCIASAFYMFFCLDAKEPKNQGSEKNWLKIVQRS